MLQIAGQGLTTTVRKNGNWAFLVPEATRLGQRSVTPDTRVRVHTFREPLWGGEVLPCLVEAESVTWSQTQRLYPLHWSCQHRLLLSRRNHNQLHPSRWQRTCLPLFLLPTVPVPPSPARHPPPVQSVVMEEEVEKGAVGRGKSRTRVNDKRSEG